MVAKSGYYDLICTNKKLLIEIKSAVRVATAVNMVEQNYA